jgi:hypothetical protein
LVVDEVFEPISALGCRGESQPVSGRYSVENVEEGACGDMVAFVDDHETVGSGQVFDVLAAG